MPNDTTSKTLKILESIKNRYTSTTMSARILNTQLNRRKYETNIKWMSSTDILNIYNEYNIPYYESKKDFIKQHKEYEYIKEIDGKQFLKVKELPITDKQVEALWEVYSKRHKLIISGQYVEMRDELYKENYAGALRRLGATQKEIDQIMSLSHDDLQRLLNEGGASKEATSKYALPEIGLFSYDDVSQLAEVRERIRHAFETILDRPYEYDEKEVSDYYKKLKRFVVPEDYEQLEEEDNVSYYSLIDNIDVGRIQKSRPDKHGNTHYFIRFLGSEKGKNKELIKDIVSRKKRLGEL